jgi:1-acyl-sn-glycerol-3-phosphate acyltransferase
VVLPQWVLDLVRPIVRSLSRLLWRIDFQGVENIPRHGGLIIAANHQAYLDPFLISIPIRRPIRYLAWNVALRWPLVGRLMMMLGAWPLQLQGSDPVAIRRSLQWLRGGGAVMIFPEGGRGHPDGSMIRFKAGAVRMALETGVPILPVTIKGANAAWPNGRWLPRLGHIQIIYHPLLQVEQQENEEVRACARRENVRLAQIIRSAL